MNIHLCCYVYVGLKEHLSEWVQTNEVDFAKVGTRVHMNWIADFISNLSKSFACTLQNSSKHQGMKSPIRFNLAGGLSIYQIILFLHFLNFWLKMKETHTYACILKIQFSTILLRHPLYNFIMTGCEWIGTT